MTRGLLRKLDSLSPGWITFGLALLLLLPWVFFGLDLGDQSYYSLASWLIAFHPVPPPGTLPIGFEAVPVWFSFYLDSLIWRVVGEDASLLTLRLAWVLLSATGFGILAAGLRMLASSIRPLHAPHSRFNSPVFAAIVTLIVYASAAEHFAFSYNHIPPALAALAFIAWGLSFHAPPRTQAARRWAMVSGFLAACSMGARMPMIPFWILLLVIVFLFGTVPRGSRSAWIFGACAGGVTLIACIVSSGQGPYAIHGLRSFADGVLHTTNARFSSTQTQDRLFTHLSKIGFGGLIFLGSVLMDAGIKRVLPTKSIAPKVFLGLSVLSFIVLALVKYGVLLAIILGGALTVLGRIGWAQRHQLSPTQRILLLGSVFVLFAPLVGSLLDGIQSYKYTGLLALPLAWLWGNRTERLYLASAATSLFVVTRVLWVSFPYPDYSIVQQTEWFQSPRLRGIGTFPLKRNILDSVIRELEVRGLKSGDSLLAYTVVPPYYPTSWVYLATRTIPLLHDPGLVEYPGSRWPRHRSWIEEASAEALPNLVLRQEADLPRPLGLRATFRGPPQVGAPPPVQPLPPNWIPLELDLILQAKGYAPVWSNGYFSILSRRPHS